MQMKELYIALTILGYGLSSAILFEFLLKVKRISVTGKKYALDATVIISIITAYAIIGLIITVCCVNWIMSS